MFAWKTDRKEKYRTKWRIAAALTGSVLGGALVGVCSLVFTQSDLGRAMFLSYFKNPYILLLNLLFPVLLSLLFYLLTNRAVCAFLLTNLVVMVPAFINYYKIALRGDAFIFEDMSLIGESKKMLETYKLFWNDRIAAYLAALVVCTLIIALVFRGRFRRVWPRLVAALVLVAASCCLAPLYTSEDIYNVKTANNDLINPYNDTQRYVSKGFVYSFLHTARDAFHPAPDGYDGDEAGAALAAFTDEVIPKERKVNLVCVMLEAYNDFSRFEELTFSRDVYGKYRELEGMGYSGTLITDVFAGDTRISEREFLTGLPYSRLDNFVSPANSYVWYLKQNGYFTTGAHPCYAWFYNRQNINKNLGFDEYLFSENYFAERTGGNITYDARFFPMLYELYTTRDKSKPYFNYSITYQCHGPYESKTAYFDSPYVESKGLSPEAETIFNNYLNAQRETTELLYKFAMDMLATDEPLVLVFFGDHKPWLGNADSVYHELGINIDTATEEGFLNYYSTRYLIIANDAAKKACGNDFSGEGETVSVSMLMNKVFELCGFRGNAYMQLVSEQMKKTPIIHRTADLRSDALRGYDDVTYYYRKNFAYNK